MTTLPDRIREVLFRPGYKPLKPVQLANQLRIKKKELWEFRAALDELVASGEVRQGRNGLLRPQSVSRGGDGLVTGLIKRIATGAGYLIPHELPDGGERRLGDIYVAPEHMRDAHTGDEVMVRLLKRRRRGGQRCGVVESVVERSSSTFVGTYFEEDGQGLVQIDGKTFNDPVIVGDPGSKGAQVGDKVVIEMLRFPSQHQPGEGVLTKVLGPRGEPGIDTLSIIYEFGLPDEFSERTLNEARLQVEQFDEDDFTGRVDLTKETIVTIDPADARDFDDAISLSRDPSTGHWLLGVHVADVSQFVQPGSALDEEARKRGTSVYLPDRVIPMIPEVISNGLASLQKGRHRYAKSVFIELTPEGIPVETRLENTVIQVTRRFAYEEVLPIIREPERFRTRVSAKVRTLLARMYELAMILRVRRFAGGALELNIGEVKLELDKRGEVAGAHEVVHDESHQIIEEFMLAANMAVARELTDREIPFLRRVHGDPDEMKLRSFAEFCTALGYPLKRYQSRRDLQLLLDRVRGTFQERAINYALLRSMKQAEYVGIEEGHYALAVDDYCHFTSPIRRYPDLTVHRLVDELIRHPKRFRFQGGSELAKLGKHCSLMERRAEQAERELTKVKLLRWVSERIGEELTAVITGVEPFGVFCQGVEIPVEGLIHISWLSVDDYFDYDATGHSLVGRRSGQVYQLGAEIRVAVAHVDVDRRELDFRIVPDQKRKRGANPAAGKGKGTDSERPAASSKGGETTRRGRTSESRKGGKRKDAVSKSKSGRSKSRSTSKEKTPRRKKR